MRGDLDEIVRDQSYSEVNGPAANDADEGGQETAEDDEMEADESCEEEEEDEDEDEEGAINLIAALRDSAHDPHRTPDLVRAAVNHHVLWDIANVYLPSGLPQKHRMVIVPSRPTLSEESA